MTVFGNRVKGRISCAVGKAIEAKKTASDILEIKDERGVIRDSVRETIADLIGVEDVPAKSSFRVFEKCATLAGKHVVGSWDRRTVPRIMHETEKAAETLIVEQLSDSIGSSINKLHNEERDLNFSNRALDERRWCFTQQYSVLIAD